MISTDRYAFDSLSIRSGEYKTIHILIKYTGCDAGNHFVFVGREKELNVQDRDSFVLRFLEYDGREVFHVQMPGVRWTGSIPFSGARSTMAEKYSCECLTEYHRFSPTDRTA